MTIDTSMPRAGRRLAAALAAGAVLAGGAGLAEAQSRLTLKSAASTSSYYVMTVQRAEMLRAESDGAILPTVEESQGSVQNVMEAGRRPGGFLFTTPPNLLDDAWAGAEPFHEGGGDYDGIRTLFPMPFITIHFVVRADSGIESVADLAGTTFIAGGTGTFCATQTEAVLDLLGLSGDITAPEMELSGAPAALRNQQADGYATCSSHPTPQVQELASTLDIRILSFSEEERAEIIEQYPTAGPITIAAGTYAGIDEDIETVAVPVGAYGTNIDDETAGFIVEQFWAQRDALAEENPWWAGVESGLIGQLRAPLHPGAASFYEEQGIDIPDEMR
ncbi:TAXI family TRAP transporter solute-binding subunit [soil metagenome]